MVPCPGLLQENTSAAHWLYSSPLNTVHNAERALMANKGGPVSSNFNTDVIYVSFNQMKSGWSHVEMLVHMCAAYLWYWPSEQASCTLVPAQKRNSMKTSTNRGLWSPRRLKHPKSADFQLTGDSQLNASWSVLRMGNKRRAVQEKSHVHTRSPANMLLYALETDLSTWPNQIIICTCFQFLLL